MSGATTHEAHPPLPSPRSSATSEAQKVSFFSALKKKLKGGKEKKKKKEIALKLTEHPKEDDRLFDIAQKNFLEMEVAMIKLHSHLEKQLAAMQDSMTHQYTISGDLSYFYCSKGSPFTKGVEEYKLKSTELNKYFNQVLFPSYLQSVLTPIRVQLSALPNIKSLIEDRTRRRIELELYKVKCAKLRKDAGLPASDVASLPNDANEGGSTNQQQLDPNLQRKHKKLHALMTEHARLDHTLLSSLVRYVNSKDLILNQSLRMYFEILQEFESKTLVLHSTDVKMFLKNLKSSAGRGEEPESPLSPHPHAPSHHLSNSGGGGMPNGGTPTLHRKSSSVHILSPTRNPYSVTSPVTSPTTDSASSAAAGAAGSLTMHGARRLPGNTTTPSLNVTQPVNPNATNLLSVSSATAAGRNATWTNANTPKSADATTTNGSTPTNAALKPPTAPTTNQQQISKTPNFRSTDATSDIDHLRFNLTPASPASPTQNAAAVPGSTTSTAISITTTPAPSTVSNRYSMAKSFDPALHLRYLSSGGGAASGGVSGGLNTPPPNSGNSTSPGTSASVRATSPMPAPASPTPPMHMHYHRSSIGSPTDLQQDPDPSSSLLLGFRKLHAEAQARDARKQFRRVSGITRQMRQGNGLDIAANMIRAGMRSLRHATLEHEIPYTSPRANGMTMYQDHIFIANIPFKQRHEEEFKPKLDMIASPSFSSLSSISSNSTSSMSLSMNLDSDAYLTASAAQASRLRASIARVASILPHTGASTSSHRASPSTLAPIQASNESDEEELPGPPPPMLPEDWDDFSDSDDTDYYEESDEDDVPPPAPSILLRLETPKAVTPSYAHTMPALAAPSPSAVHATNAILSGFGTGTPPNMSASASPSPSASTNATPPIHPVSTPAHSSTTHTANQGTPAFMTVPNLAAPVTRSPAVSITGIQRGGPILTGKFSALSERFGTRTPSVSITGPPRPTQSTTPTATTAPAPLTIRTPSPTNTSGQTGPASLTNLIDSSPFSSPVVPQRTSTATGAAVPLTIQFEDFVIPGPPPPEDDVATTAEGIPLIDFEAGKVASPPQHSPVSSPRAISRAVPTTAAAPTTFATAGLRVVPPSSSPAGTRPFATFDATVGRSAQVSGLTSPSHTKSATTMIDSSSTSNTAATKRLTFGNSSGGGFVASSPFMRLSKEDTKDTGSKFNSLATAPEIVIALYDYAPQRAVEIPLKQGDLLSIVSKDESGWWSGFVVPMGKVGVFPSNFCRTITHDTVR